MAADLTSIRRLAKNKQLNWSVHATQRVCERGISSADAIAVLSDDANEILETQPPIKPWQNERYAVYCSAYPEIIVIVTVIFDSLPKLQIITVENPAKDKWNKNPTPPPTLVRNRT